MPCPDPGETWTACPPEALPLRARYPVGGKVQYVSYFESDISAEPWRIVKRIITESLSLPGYVQYVIVPWEKIGNRGHDRPQVVDERQLRHWEEEKI